jgi:erythronate-4-phosphate dehydrogenase
MKIIADNKIPYLQGALEPFAELTYLPGGDIKKEHLLDADALIIRTRTKCNAELLEGTTVKFIATATIGYDHIDTDYCDKAGIKWTNAPGCNSSSVQQYIASAILFLAVERGFKLEDRTLGVVGVGNVGSKVVKLAEAIGLRVLLNDPPRVRAEGQCGFVTLDTIIKECDIITFHVPLNINGQDKTFHLADDTFFKQVDIDTIIINSSRGEVVDNKALKKSLSNERLSGAILDVWEGEPEIDQGLLNLVDIATPHIAGYSRDGKANGTAMSVQAISRFFGLGIDDWYPEKLEIPAETKIEIDCKGHTKEEILLAAFGNTYDITEDDKRLGESPETFEKQRNDYPVRREFTSYEIKLLNDDKGYGKLLSELGFIIAG